MKGTGARGDSHKAINHRVRIPFQILKASSFALCGIKVFKVEEGMRVVLVDKLDESNERKWAVNRKQGILCWIRGWRLEPEETKVDKVAPVT